MLASNLIKALGITKVFPDFNVTDIVFDSRLVKKDCIFVCIRGSAVDGHNFAEAAAKAGAGVIIAQERLNIEAPVIVTENTKIALAVLSAEFFNNPAKKLKTIGITGTKGKTTTAFMLKSILEAAGNKVGVIGTIGVSIGDEIFPTENTTPASYLVQKFMAKMVEQGCNYCIMEASSIGLKDFRIYGFTYDIGVFTNFSQDHIGGVEHKDMQEYLQSKAMLFSMCRIGVLNIDDPSTKEILENHSCQPFYFGFGQGAEIRGVDTHLISRPSFAGCGLKVVGKVEQAFEIGIPGKFNAYNALGAIATCYHLGIDMASVKSGLEKVKVKGRMEPVSTNGDYTLILDYAHNAVSMENLLKTLREYSPKRLVCMFGAGGNRPKARRYEMGEACGSMADLSVITADNSRFEEVEDIIADIKVGMGKTKGEFVEIKDRKQAMKYCIKNARTGDIIVFAGKGSEDYQEIKGVKYPFDERVIIKEILEELSLEIN